MLLSYLKGSAHANVSCVSWPLEECVSPCQDLSKTLHRFRKADVQPTHHIAAKQEVSEASDDLGASFDALLGVVADRRQMGRGHSPFSTCNTRKCTSPNGIDRRTGLQAVPSETNPRGGPKVFEGVLMLQRPRYVSHTFLHVDEIVPWVESALMPEHVSGGHTGCQRSKRCIPGVREDHSATYVLNIASARSRWYHLISANPLSLPAQRASGLSVALLALHSPHETIK